MDYSSGSGVVATQTAVLYLPRGRCRCLCLHLMAKAAAGIEAGAETKVGHLQAETAAGQLRPQRWLGYLPCRDGGGGIDGIRNGDSGQAEPPGV